MTTVKAQGINSKPWLFVLTEKKPDHVVSFHNTEIKNDAMQHKMHNKAIISKKKGCTKTVIMQASGNRRNRKEDKPQTSKFHLKRPSKQPSPKLLTWVASL